MTVRQAGRDDIEASICLLGQFALECGFTSPSDIVRGRLIETGWGLKPQFAPWIAEEEGAVVAIAVVTEHFLTSAACPTMSIEDLYVAKERRGRGLGQAFVKALVQECEENAIDCRNWMGSKVSGTTIDFFPVVEEPSMNFNCFKMLPSLFLDPVHDSSE